MNIRELSAVAVAAVTGSILLLSASAASAASAAVTGSHHPSSGHGTKSPIAPRRPIVPFNLPAGYTLATSTYTAPAGTQTGGEAACPGTEQPVGGGAYVGSSDLQVNINSSYPLDSTWGVDVDNASSLPSSFTVYAVCMAYSSSYHVVITGPWTAYSEYVSSQPAECTKGQVMGGGAYSGSTATDVYINSTVPNTFAGGHTGWRVAMASSDPSNTSFYVYAVCRAAPAGYSLQYGAPVANGPYSETEAVVTCPGASVPVGGGGFSIFQSEDAWIAMNTSFPSGQSWDIYENNYEDLTRQVEASAVCAGT